MAYLKLVLYSILFVLLALFMIRFCFYVNRNVSHDLQLELELADIEMRALNEQIEIVELLKKILEEKMIDEKILDKMNEDVVVIVNPDGQQLQLGTKIN